MRTDINSNMYKQYLYHRLPLLPCSVWILMWPACNKKKRAESVKAQGVQNQEKKCGGTVKSIQQSEGTKTKEAKRGGGRGEEAWAWLEGDRERGRRTSAGPGHFSIPPLSAERREAHWARASSVPFAEHPQGRHLLPLTGILSAQRVRRIKLWNNQTGGDLAWAITWFPSVGSLFAPVCHS